MRNINNDILTFVDRRIDNILNSVPILELEAEVNSKLSAFENRLCDKQKQLFAELENAMVELYMIKLEQVYIHAIYDYSKLTKFINEAVDI